jgi:predicted porin
MKNAALAIAVFTAMVSGGSFAATVYDNEGTTLKVGGRVEARFNISDDNETATRSTFQDLSRARLNLTGRTEIVDGLYGFGEYESEFEDNDDSGSSDDSDDITNRYFYAGFGTMYGELSYGKQDSAQVQITDFTDMMNTFDEAAADLFAENGDTLENNFLYAGEFDTGVIGPMTIKANYITSDTKDDNSFGFSVIIEPYEDLQLGAGYVDHDNGNNSEDQLNIGVHYMYDSFAFGGIYGDGTVVQNNAEVDADDFELGASYTYNMLSFIIVYNYQEVDSTDTVDHFAVEVEQRFNPYLRTYAGYMFQQLDDQDDQFQAGIRYDF